MVLFMYFMHVGPDNIWHHETWSTLVQIIPDSMVHGAYMGPIWGRQDPGGPHVGPMSFAIWDGLGPETSVIL